VESTPRQSIIVHSNSCRGNCDYDRLSVEVRTGGRTISTGFILVPDTIRGEQESAGDGDWHSGLDAGPLAETNAIWGRHVLQKDEVIQRLVQFPELLQPRAAEEPGYNQDKNMDKSRNHASNDRVNYSGLILTSPLDTSRTSQTTSIRPDNETVTT
jgi:hypothetical protein